MSPSAIEVIAPADAAVATAGHDDRVIDAALECFGRWGIAKTTAEDIAREAGISRATVYRSFPGGKASILEAVGVREIGRLMAEALAVTEQADDLETVLVDGISTMCRSLRSHRALNFLIVHEPEAVLPFLAFDRLGPALHLARTTCAPSVSRFVPLDTAEEIVEWATRMILSLTFAPGLTDPGDREAIRTLVRDLFLPGFTAEISSNETSSPSKASAPTAKDTP